MKRYEFEEWFKAVTGFEGGPFPYQKQLAIRPDPDLPRLLNVPTGGGKTAAVILAWLWRRRFHPDDAVRAATPRRLVYCLPMRVLVEQTRDRAVEWLNAVDLLAGSMEENDPKGIYEPQWAGSETIPIFTLMGGEPATEWEAFPERDAILVGTQDMLLSRALNRGYAAKPPMWPVHFGLLNVDAQWIMDEVQLMGVGRTSSVQLQHFFDHDGAEKRLPLPRRTLWMSATLGTNAGEVVTPTWMATPERSACAPESIAGAHNKDLAREDFKKRWNAPKRLEHAEWTTEEDDLVGLQAFQEDPETDAIVMIGEIGGDAEERAAAYIEQHVTKPVAAYVAGFTAPEGKTMGHAGAIVSGSAGTAQAKKEALEKAGAHVGKTPSETARLVRDVLARH